MSDNNLNNNVIRFDWAMKRILCKKANLSVLNGFLSVVLGETIEIVELLESENDLFAPDDTFNHVDLKAKNSKGDIVLIEIQNSHDATYFPRFLYSTSKAISEYINLGSDYRTLKKFYSISIVYFDFGQGDDYIYKGTTEFHNIPDPSVTPRLSPGQRMRFNAEKPSEILPEYYILQVNNFNETATTPIEEWVTFLKKSVIPESFTAPGLPEARRLLQIDQLSLEERREYERMVDFVASQTPTSTPLA